MKALVVSDTHGHLSRLPLPSALPEGVEVLLHLGDFASDAGKIAERYGISKVYAVRGNCDGVTDTPSDLIVELGGVRLFLTHGNRFYSTYELALCAEEQRCDAVLFGHTHTPLLTAQSSCLIVNPGSPTYPRDSKPSYAILIIKEGQIDVKLCPID